MIRFEAGALCGGLSSGRPGGSGGGVSSSFCDEDGENSSLPYGEISLPGGNGGGMSSLPGGNGGGSSLPGGNGGGTSSLPGGNGGGTSPLPGGSGGKTSSLPGGNGGGPSSTGCGVMSLILLLGIVWTGVFTTFLPGA